jgi:acylphosphatase
LGDLIKIYMLVHGIVQGVGYRAYVKGQADKFSIKGYAKNLDDGSVEVFAIGSDDSIDAFANSIHINVEHGPDVFYIEKHKEGEEGFVDGGIYESFRIIK